jgi:hypothetical protein
MADVPPLVWGQMEFGSRTLGLPLPTGACW